jgi:cystathionine beta-lyase family protein involved in aluminum resistance
MIIDIINECEKELNQSFKTVENIALSNQEKVLNAFQNNRIALRHFAPTSGYGYDDIGRDTLCALFADVFHTEKAIVSPLIANGTHALTLALFGVLRPNDTLLYISGTPYDTLENVIGGKDIGSLKDFGISFAQTELKDDGSFDKEAISKAINEHNPKMIAIQRSRGYSWRNALKMSEFEDIISFVKNIKPDVAIMVDNCYGEFVDVIEPSDVGADIVVGSLIKNPGGGLAPTGGYIAGKEKYVDLIAGRLTAPGIGMEVGSYLSTYQYFYQGLFLAPHVVSQAIKASLLFSAVFSKLGYKVLPAPNEIGSDIITSIEFNEADELIKFCQAIQACSPIDSFVTPEPWDMPGYNHQVIMAAGTFVQGASIEMSADSPIKKPYIAYFQGSLTYEHAKLALKKCLELLEIN